MGYIIILMDYFEGEKWVDFCREASKYHHGVIKGNTPIKFTEVRQEFIFDVLVSIINLISFFSKMNSLKNNPSYKVIEAVNNKLNNAGREEFLFKGLELNNDRLRLAIMKCLYNVPLNQFSTDEVSKMVSLLTSFRNPTSGIIEIVLGKMILLLSKIVLDNTKSLGREFRKAQARTAISDCLLILEQCYQELPNDEDQNDRVYLAISCIYFIQSCSKFPNLGRFISESTELYNKILKADEYTQKLNLDYCPLPAEATSLSSSIHNNLWVFVSTNTIDQYSDVCLRVLETIADLLSGKKGYTDIEIPSNKVNESGDIIDPMEIILKAMKAKVLERHIKEEEPWIGLQDARKHLNNDEIDKDELQNSINEFIRNDMIDIVLNYLIGNSAHKCAPELESYLLNFSKGKVKVKELRDDIKEEVHNIKSDFRAKLEEMSAISEEKKEEEEKIEDRIKISPKEIIVTNLEREELAFDKYLPGSIMDRGISIQGELDTKEKMQSPDNIDYKGSEKIRPFTNKKKRALTLAAFMRCIYHVYAFSDSKGKNAILKRLRDKKNMKMLTQLLFTTDWLEGNVGAKYLRLCQPVLQLDSKSNYGSDLLIELNEIVCSAAREILQLMFNRFKNEDKVPFTEKENLLLSELASFGRCLFTQVLYLKYSQMDPYEEKKLSNKKQKITPGGSADDDEIYFLIPPRLKIHGPKFLECPQYLCAKYTLRRLLPYESMYTFTLMIFYFARKLDEINSSPGMDDKLTQLMRVEEARAAASWALASYMSLCKEEKYMFLEAIMKQCIFEKKYLRKSYIQEILTLTYNNLIITAIVVYKQNHRKVLYLKIIYRELEKRNEFEVSLIVTFPCIIFLTIK